MNAFVEMRPQLIKVHTALKQLDKEDLAKKVDDLDSAIFEFFVELNDGFTLPPKPTGWFSGKKKKLWELHNSIKNNLNDWTKTYNS
jgi:hypothetical protein